jgi:hypothetical protein
MSDTLEYLRMFGRFPFALRRFLRSTLTLEDARRIIRERMEHREQSFLRVVERSVYGSPASPYLRLLRIAGCELGDLRALVKQKGLEGTLRQLRAAGVYVTFEEFKGRKPIVRNGTAIPVKPRDFDNPFARRDFVAQSSGSTGLAQEINQNLDSLGAEAPYHLISLAAYGLLNVPLIIWTGFLPGSGLRRVLLEAYCRQPLWRWYSPSGWRDSKYWLKYDLATLYMIFWIRAYGRSAPFPRIAKSTQALDIARTMSKIIQTHGRCLLFAPPSRAMRVSIAAQQAGIDLRGGVTRGGGEPLTPAKAHAIQQAGMHHIPSYVMTETGIVAYGCAMPKSADDMHLVTDWVALITTPHTVENIGVTVPALNLTTLSDSAPKLMLNVQVDDYGIVEERHCGCDLETYGYTTHLREVRSYSKLVGEGATLIGNEMLQILEELLPKQFGGSALDYQLMEQEDELGFTRLYLNISPSIEIADEQAVLDVVLKGLRESSPMSDAARSVWQPTNTIQIKRIEPMSTGRGKLFPLHIHRSK